MAQTGNGATVTLSATSFSPSYISLGGFDLTREALDDTSLTNSSYMSKVPADLVDIGSMRCEYFYVPGSSDAQPPIIGTNSSAQTLTITYGTSETIAGTGFITSSTIPQIINGELMRGTLEWQWDGKTGPTFTATT